MKPNTRIKTPEGRIGTICYHNLDGYGGVWGIHHFELSKSLPPPEFLLRRDKKRLLEVIPDFCHRFGDPGLELVDRWEIDYVPEDTP